MAELESVGVRELAERASAVITAVETTGHPVLVTRRGRPVAVVSAIDQEALYDYVLAHAPEFVRDRREAEEAFARGEDDTKPLAQVLAELAAEDAAEDAAAAAAAGGSGQQAAGA